ncbi:MAG: class I SAM-dependent methyltransferase [Thermoflavifilum sp.]|nr:class I SAM-dependent methyltransferase [Thermoflavifilum sp.]
MSVAQFWDERYGQPEYVYGKQPNKFFQEQIDQLSPGRILLPAEGEGRNGVYAAQKGWRVDAFDISAKGRHKALQLAAAAGVSIHYQVGDLDHLSFTPASYDVVGLIFAHFPASHRRQYHRQLMGLLKPGGRIILEGFSKAHRAYQQENPHVGGPQEEKLLFSQEELLEDFAGLDIVLLEEPEVSLQEGLYHIGKGRVIRLIALKPLS